MPKPRRRRRFFALEGRFEVDNMGELQGIAEPARTEPASADDAAGGGDFAEPATRSDAATDDALPAAFELTRAPRSRAPQKPFVTWTSVLLVLAGLLVGLCAGYAWSGARGKTVAIVPAVTTRKETIQLTAADRDDLDAAYVARHARNFAEANRLFGALAHRHADWGPIEVESGRTLFYAGRPYDAIFTLKKAAEKGWKPGEANFLLGVINTGRKMYTEAEADFAAAVALDPTEPDYYFFWGECLRGEGKLMEATKKFHSALLRNQYETATGLYRAKLWLCAIEAGQSPDNTIAAQAAAELTLPQPPMEALVAAAARDIKAGDFPAAAAHLSAASQRSDPVVFHYILSDPFFAGMRTKPELAKFFQTTIRAPSPTVAPAESSPAPALEH